VAGSSHHFKGKAAKMGHRTLDNRTVQLSLVGAGLLGIVSTLNCASSNQEAVEKDNPVQAVQESENQEAAAEASAENEVKEWQERIDRYAVAELTADISGLPESEKKALMEIIHASRLLDPVFDRQAFNGNPELRKTLAADTSEIGKAKFRYFQIHRGPWDRQEHFSPFATSEARPAGAGYYPNDVTAEEFKSWVKSHPDDAAALESLFTIVKRENDALVAVPYRTEFKEWLEPAAAKLKGAAALTENASLKTFLNSRANAFATDDYYQSDKDWMDLDSLVEVTIGPYEVYEDKLLGLKAAYESFVTVSDPVASARLVKFKKLLPDMEQNLPVPDEVKAKRGRESPIRVVDLVFSSGDARKSVQTIAFNLPNDERVRKEKGAKKVLLRNSIQTKFEKIMRPIAQQILVPEQLPFLSAEAFFQEVLFHELSHSLGPAFTTIDGKQVEVRVALESSYSSIEEAKADVMGAYNILFMIEKGEFPPEFKNQLLVSYFAGLFRSVRFGVSEAHGQGAALQINRFLEEKAASFNDETQLFQVDLVQLEKSISDLVRDLCLLQHGGDKAAADALLAQFAVVSPPMEKALSKLGGIPVDLRPYYPLAGETLDTVK
jgi:hypothetical protein